MTLNRSGKKVLSRDNIFGGAARLLYADAAEPKPTQIDDIINAAVSPYAARSGWNDVGATDGGAEIVRSYETQDIEVDQVAGVYDKEVTSWSMQLTTSLVETTLENFQIAWVASSTITTNSGTPSGYPDERRMGLGAPTCLPERMIALIVDKREDCVAGTGYVRAYVFWIAQVDGAESSHAYRKGEKTMLPVTFNILPDSTEEAGEEFGIILDQVVA